MLESGGMGIGCTCRGGDVGRCACGWVSDAAGGGKRVRGERKQRQGRLREGGRTTTMMMMKKGEGLLIQLGGQLTGEGDKRKEIG